MSRGRPNSKSVEFRFYVITDDLGREQSLRSDDVFIAGHILISIQDPDWDTVSDRSEFPRPVNIARVMDLLLTVDAREVCAKLYAVIVGEDEMPGR
jgi:hypothetical protein